MSNDTNDPQNVPLSKEDLSKIVEDPYFQYLVKEKARAQTKAYLVLVSSVILGVLAYGGWEFKSIRDLLETEKVAIEKEKAAVLSHSEKVREAAADVTAKKDKVAQDIDGARDITEQSKFAVGTMLAAARDNVTNSQQSQERFYEQQKDLLSTFSTVHSKVSEAANKQLEQVGGKLDEVKTLAAETRKQAEKSAAQINEVLRKADEIEKKGSTLTGLTEDAVRLDGIQKKLLQGGIVGTVFMRAQQLQTIKMLDPYDPLGADSEWYITFKRFHLNSETLHVIGEAKKGSSGTPLPFEVTDISARPSPNDYPTHSLLRWKIPFRLQLNFAYHTKLSRDFVSLKIYGEEAPKSKLAAR